MEESKSVKINCDFCQKQIECPPEMLDIQKHACYECFQDLRTNEKLTGEEIENVHVDAPIDKIMEDAMMSVVNEVFDEMWREERDKLIGVSKDKLAEAMFVAGAHIMFKQITDFMKESKEQSDKKEEKESVETDEEK